MTTDSFCYHTLKVFFFYMDLRSKCMKIKNKGSLKAGSLKGGSRMKEWYQMNEEEVLKMLDAD